MLVKELMTEDPVCLEAEEPVTAVFAMADVLAVGAMRCIRDRCLRVPEDISVVGFDGMSIGRYYSPRLTSVYQKADQLAEESVALLVDALHGAPACHKTTPYELVPLESVKDCI
jgi:LacI family transcriptional regulator